MFYDFKAGVRRDFKLNRYYLINKSVLIFIKEVESDHKLLFIDIDDIYNIDASYIIIDPFDEKLRIEYIGNRHDVAKKYPQYMI